MLRREIVVDHLILVLVLVLVLVLEDYVALVAQPLVKAVDKLSV